MTSLIGVGDNTVDTYVHLRKLFPGGNAVNVAVFAKQLGHDAGYLGWLGKDERGDFILSSLKAEGLDVSYCRQVTEKPTAFSTVELVDGDRVFGPADNGACDLIYLEDEDFRYIHAFDVVHTSVFSHLEDQLPLLKKASKYLSFDLSQRRDLDYLKRVLPHTDIVFISLSEIPLSEQENLLRMMQAMGPKLVVATRGKQGSWVFDGNKFFHQAIIPVEVVDTLGAGDAFAACFLMDIRDGIEIPQAMEHSAHFAAQNCAHYGAFGYGKPY